MKKNIYIASGDTAAYENLTCKNITVDGELHINGTLTADNIGGTGVIKASAIRAKTVRSGVLDAGSVVADIIMARHIFTTEMRAKESVTASSFIEAGLVKSPKVIIADAEIKDIQTDEMIMISAKPHSIFGALILSVLRSMWVSVFGNTAVSVQCESAPGAVAECVDDEGNIESELSPEVSFDETPDTAAETPEYFSTEAAAHPTTLEMQDALELLEDPEFRRLVAMRKMARKYGGIWTLKSRTGAIDISAEDFEDGTHGAAA